MAGAVFIAQGIDRRRAIVRFIKAYSKKNGCSPSVAEIAEGVELASKTAVRNHLAVLRREGVIDWIDGRHRSFRVVEKAS